MGKISPKKTRTVITIDKMFKKQLEKLAELEERSFNSLIMIATREYFEKHKDKLQGIEFTYDD